MVDSDAGGSSELPVAYSRRAERPDEVPIHREHGHAVRPGVGDVDVSLRVQRNAGRPGELSRTLAVTAAYHVDDALVSGLISKREPRDIGGELKDALDDREQFILVADRQGYGLQRLVGVPDDVAVVINAVANNLGEHDVDTF